MRTALLLLLLLALAAVPGSIIPQTNVDAVAVDAYARKYPDLTPWLDRLGLFSVYSSVWFSAIYLLLMVSLVGCIVPRTGHYLRALRARPPATPRHLLRLPHSQTYETAEPVDVVLDRAEAVLQARRFRTDVRAEGAPDSAEAGSVAAQRGYSREAGNLLFHVGVVVVLVGVAVGGLVGYRGSVIVSEGGAFSNTLTQYDQFSSGVLFTEDDLEPFTVNLEQFDAEFETSGPQAGAPRLFRAAGTYTAVPGAAAQPFDIEVNYPLQINGTEVYLLGTGYSPAVTVRDAKGDVVTDGPVPFLPVDSSYTSEGVVKAPDAAPRGLGFEGVLLPTAVEGPDGVAMSAFPDAANPVLNLFAYFGDLGLDDGEAQSVYTLDTDEMTSLKGPDGKQLRLQLSVGETLELPDGRGSITFDGVRRFARFQVSQSPGKVVPLAALVVALSGLVLSLYVRPRRAWVRARRTSGRTVVELAGLDRTGGDDLGPDLGELVVALRGAPARTGVEPGANAVEREPVTTGKD
jgi:cytochrome c biogenesis protein